MFALRGIPHGRIPQTLREVWGAERDGVFLSESVAKAGVLLLRVRQVPAPGRSVQQAVGGYGA